MNPITKIIIVVFAMICANIENANAQNKITTDTLTVNGCCKSCKNRIEEAAFISGVKDAVWNKTTHILTLTFNTQKTSIDKISQALANSGHDNRLHTATEKAYKNLPSCCAYRNGKCEHD